MMHFRKLAIPAALASLVLMSGVAGAGEDHGRGDRGRDDRGREDRGREDRGREDRGREDRGREDRGREDRGTNGHGGIASSVPELSIGAAGGALVVLVGSLLVWRGRRRRVGDR